MREREKPRGILNITNLALKVVKLPVLLLLNKTKIIKKKSLNKTK